jgi:hypothetical protein
MTDRGPEVNEEYSRKVSELVRLIELLPPERQERLRRELEAGTLDLDGLKRETEEREQ